MICKISCSFGEVVDKMTILKIKESKASDKTALLNIQTELRTIVKENPMVHNNDILFDKLFNINKKLWVLEDLIREKSRNKEFDQLFIKYANSIHITNDERYEVKKEINIKYNSTLKEEKIYLTTKKESNPIKQYTKKDVNNLETGKLMYTSGNYKKSMKIIENLIDNFKDTIISCNLSLIEDSFYIDLLFSYSNICDIYNKQYPYFDILKQLMTRIDSINISNEQKNFCKTIYAMKCLTRHLYKEAYLFLNYINDITAPGTNKYNMSFFKKEDTEKTLLVYDGGGIGDKFMLSRFIPKLCIDYDKNNIIFLVSDNLKWIFKDIFKKYNNLSIVSDKEMNSSYKYNYHCNLLSLIKYLNYEYDTIPHIPLFKQLKCPGEFENYSNNSPYYVFNWKGNSQCMHEKNNRSIKIEYAIPLFKLNIDWVVITKDLNMHERNLLDKYNVKYFDKIDMDKSFYDSISILRNSRGIVSTDTALVHLSANLDIPTYVLLTLGNEWRWRTYNTDNHTNWYPDVTLVRQSKLKDWDNVINELISKHLVI